MQRRRLVFAACAFCVAAACAFGLTADAATLNIQTYAKGSDFVFGSSSTSFAATSGDLLTQPPLPASTEVVMGGQSDNLFAAGGGTYQASLTVDSQEILKSGTQRDVSLTGPGSYQEAAYYLGAGNSALGGPCGETQAGNTAGGNVTTEGNLTIPAFNEMAYVTSGFSGNALKYQSTIALSALAVEQPDTLVAQMQGSGDGYAWMHTGVVSQIGFTNCTSMGYEQTSFTDIAASGPDMQIGTLFQFASFRDAFSFADLPAATG